MNNNEEKILKESSARRRVLAAIGVLSALAFIATAVRLPGYRKTNLIGCMPEKKPRMVKMLAEDGSLVEIDADLIKSGSKKVSNSELQHWIKR